MITTCGLIWSEKRYVKNNNIFFVKAYASLQWRNLLYLGDTFKKGMPWQIGDGKSINFWSDNWIFQYPLKSIITDIPGIDNITVSHCISPSH